MSWRRELHAVNLVLLAAIALVVWGIVHIWWGGSSLPSRAASAKGPQVPTAPILRDQQPLTAFGVVAAKNLFSQDRTGPAFGPAKAQNSLEGRQLLGIMIIGDTRAAIIGGKTTGRSRTKAEVEVVYQGEDWDGLKLIEILNNSVVFEAKDGRKTLNFPE